ncbi:hypothetical protein JYT25_00040 [bacterium AH-315-C20]|nr:hypothetical protein [bacterium AH-315-C20]
MKKVILIVAACFVATFTFVQVVNYQNDSSIDQAEEAIEQAEAKVVPSEAPTQTSLAVEDAVEEISEEVTLTNEQMHQLKQDAINKGEFSTYDRFNQAEYGPSAAEMHGEQ